MYDVVVRKTGVSSGRLLLFLSLVVPASPLLASGATSSIVALSSSVNPVVYGAPVMLTASVSPSDSTGKVTFYDGTVILGSSPVISGQATLTTILLPPGSNRISAFYSGDATYSASVATSLGQTVIAVPDGGFATPTPFGSFTSPLAVVIADFNRDGKADLAVSSLSGVAVLLGNGQGSFQQSAQLSTVNVPVGIAFGSFNGDGNLDLVVTNQDDSLSVFLGNGDGTFQSGAVTNTPSVNVGFVAVADFNGDGNADLATVDSANGAIDILPGNGDGTFQAAASYPVGNTPASVVVGDFDSDGKADVAVANTLSNTVSILLGSGTAVSSGTGLNPISIASGDFNGDGKPDLAIANEGGDVSILLGNGDGTFQNASPVTVGRRLVAITAFDLNGDGNLDLVVADYSGNDISILLGNGNATFQIPIDVPVGTNPNFVAIGDFNGDGRADLAVSDYGGQGVNVLLGTPQTAADCTFAVIVSGSQILPALGGNLAVTIQTGATCAWEITGLPNWVAAQGPSTGTGPASVTLLVAANSGDQRSAEINVATIPGLITQLSNTLSVNLGGVISAASFGTTVAPGSIAAVFGNFLVTESTSASSTPLSASLEGLSVEFSGTIPAPLFFASLTQMDFQVPWELAGQTQSTITTSYNGQTSAAQSVTVATYAPGIFGGGNGTGQGAILDLNFGLVTPTNPASAGSYVQIYCTGLGPVSNQPATGAAAPASEPFAITTTIPIVTIGGVNATVVYSGLAPGSVGEYQVNVQVPSGVPPGPAVPVILAIGGVSSNTVAMGVK